MPALNFKARFAPQIISGDKDMIMDSFTREDMVDFAEWYCKKEEETDGNYGAALVFDEWINNRKDFLEDAVVAAEYKECRNCDMRLQIPVFCRGCNF